MSEQQINSVTSTDQKQEENQEFKDFMSQMSKITATSESKMSTRDFQTNRILQEGGDDRAFNPYDIFEIGPEANDVEIKKKYRVLSLLVHPDQNKHEKAADAFHILDQAYRLLKDVEKRRTFQRVMREAKEQVMVNRQKANEKRMALGQDPLPEDTINLEIKNMSKKLFDIIEEKKKHFERMDKAYKER